MKRKRLWTGIGASTGMLILILDSKTALDGATAGIDLCLKTVIPSLFPFFLLSILLTNVLTGKPISPLRGVGKLCGIPQGAESILLVGFLGGYPVGAQAIANAHQDGALTTEDAERMLGFCNNAGPAFLFGMAASLFPQPWMAWALWGLHILSAILTALMLPGKGHSKACSFSSNQISIPNALNAAVRTMAVVCGWVILLRVLIAFLTRWVLWLFPGAIQIGMIGALELSNGCCELIRIPDNSIRFLMCAAMLAMGGLCVAMQTASVCRGLSLRCYFTGKGLQTLFSVLLGSAITGNLWLPLCTVLAIFICILRKKQNNSSIQVAAGV